MHERMRKSLLEMIEKIKKMSPEELDKELGEIKDSELAKTLNFIFQQLDIPKEYDEVFKKNMGDILA